VSAHLPPAAREQIRQLVERRLSAEDVEASLRIPVSEEEHEEILALVRWFRRRYPTPAQRLAYVRRAYRRWARTARR
jgi:hypothetical protein